VIFCLVVVAAVVEVELRIESSNILVPFQISAPYVEIYIGTDYRKLCYHSALGLVKQTPYTNAGFGLADIPNIYLHFSGKRQG
jgi:hypothetical protein